MSSQNIFNNFEEVHNFFYDYDEFEQDVARAFFINDQETLSKLGVTQEILKVWKKKAGFENCCRLIKKSENLSRNRNFDISDLKKIIKVKRQYPKFTVTIDLRDVISENELLDKKTGSKLKEITSHLTCVLKDSLHEQWEENFAEEESNGTDDHCQE